MSVNKILAIFLIFLFCGTTSANIEVNTTGWWRTGGTFNASGTPIQAAINGASTYEAISIAAGTYNEATPVLSTVGTVITGAGADVTTISNSWLMDADDVEVYHLYAGDNFVDWNSATDGVIIAYCSMMYVDDIAGCTDTYFDDNKVSCGGSADGIGSTFTNTNFTDAMCPFGFYNVYGNNNIFSNSIFPTDGYIVVYAGASTNTFTNFTFGDGGEVRVLSGSNNRFTDITMGSKPSADQAAIQISGGTGTAFIDTTHTHPADHLFHVSNSATGYAIQNDNRVFVGTAGHTIANTTATNLTFADELYNYCPFWITPSTGELNITSTPLWNTSNDYKKQFNITGTTGTFNYVVGDMLPNMKVNVSTSGWNEILFVNNTGHVSGIYDGGWVENDHTFTIIEEPLIPFINMFQSAIDVFNNTKNLITQIYDLMISIFPFIISIIIFIGIISIILGGLSYVSK